METLHLKQKKFEETYFSWILNKEKELIGKKNISNEKTLTQKDWNLAYSETKQIHILIRNKIIEDRYFKKLTNIYYLFNLEKEEKTIKKILLEIHKQLLKFVKINDDGIIEDFTSKTILKNENFNKDKEIIFENNFDNFLTKHSNNLEYFKIGVCRDYSFYFLSIFQMLGFDLNKINIVSAPRHLFIRYISKKEIINFETMSKINNFKINEVYIEKYNIPKLSIKKGVFLKNSDDNMIKSFFYDNYALLLVNHFKEYNLSRKMYKKVLELNPNSSECYNNYALLLKDDYFKEYNLAREMYEKALELNSNCFEYYINYAILLQNHFNEEYNLTREMYEKALTLNLDSPECYNNYSVLLVNYFKEYNLARKMYKKALKLNPNYSECYINYAPLLQNHFKEYNLARKMYKKALKLNPNYSECYINYAILLQKHFIEYFYIKKLKFHNKLKSKIKIIKEIISLYKKFLELEKNKDRYNDNKKYISENLENLEKSLIELQNK